MASWIACKQRHMVGKGSEFCTITMFVASITKEMFCTKSKIYRFALDLPPCHI
jgi:hypothetical protein